MKAHLVWPAFEDFSGLDTTWIPHGVTQIATVANSAGHRVDVLDGRVLKERGIKQVLKNTDAEVVGISMLSSLVGFGKDIADYLAAERPDIKVALGGIHPSVAPEDFDGWPYEWLVKGEGEITFTGILNGVVPPGTVEGERPDLATLPNVDRRLITVQEEPMPGLPKPFATVIIGRGCPYNCTFCLDGDTLVMMSNFTWKKLKDIVVGDIVVGYEKAARGHTLATTPVQHTFCRVAETYEILTDRGSVIATAEHRWLSHGDHSRWRRTKNLKQGDVISWFSEPVETVETLEYKKGYLAGASLGDGSIGSYKRKNRNGYTNHFKIVGDYEMLDTFLQYAEEVGVDVHECKFNGGEIYKNVTRAVGGFSRKTVSAVAALCSRDIDTREFKRGVLAGLMDADGFCSNGGHTIRFCNCSDPNWFCHDKYRTLAELIEGHLADFGFRTVREPKSIRILGGVTENAHLVSLVQPKVPNKRRLRVVPKNGGATVIRVEPLGEQEVFNIATGTENYIANGFISHNCQPAERTLFGARLRYRPVEHVVAEIKSLGVKSFMVHDDCFTSMPSYVSDFCESLPEGVEWWCQGRADNVVNNMSLIHKMRDSGLRGMILGHESGDDRVLEALNKGVTVAQNIEATAFLKMLGVTVWSNIMLGTPNEPPSAVVNTILMVHTMQPDMTSIAIFTPHPGSKLYDECRDIMLKEDWTYYNRGRFEPKIEGQDVPFLLWAAQQIRAPEIAREQCR